MSNERHNGQDVRFIYLPAFVKTLRDIGTLSIYITKNMTTTSIVCKAVFADSFGIFYHCSMWKFKNPDPGMIKKIDLYELATPTSLALHPSITVIFNFWMWGKK